MHMQIYFQKQLSPIIKLELIILSAKSGRSYYLFAYLFVYFFRHSLPYYNATSNYFLDFRNEQYVKKFKDCVHKNEMKQMNEKYCDRLEYNEINEFIRNVLEERRNTILQIFCESLTQYFKSKGNIPHSVRCILKDGLNNRKD